jgi:hypothetical protein
MFEIDVEGRKKAERWESSCSLIPFTSIPWELHKHTLGGGHRIARNKRVIWAFGSQKWSIILSRLRAN